MPNEDLKDLLGFIDARLEPASQAACAEKDLLCEVLRKCFGLKDFRPHQRAIIEAILRKKTVLAVLPTGYGKSLCYQLPAFMDSGLTIVVSPLIALMKDQVEQLQAAGNTETAFLNSLITLPEQRKVMAQVRQGRIRLLYVAPERFRSRVFTEELSHQPLRLFVIDEAHCISHWGHDFRPDYLALHETLRRLQPDSLALFTATVTAEVEADMLQQLEVREVEKFVVSPVRPNLRFTVIPVKSETEKFQVLAHLIDRLPGKGIIYVPRKREAVEVASLLQHIKKRADFYHAGRPRNERKRIQEAFFDDSPQGLDIIAATNAFGLGINKKNLRFVLHFAIPGSLEAYYQEAGRAGRDGEPAECILLYDEEDVGLQRWFIKQSLISKKDVLRVYAMIEQRSPGYDRFRWIDPRELEWQTGYDNIKIRVVLSHLQRLGIIRQHPKISPVLKISMNLPPNSAQHPSGVCGLPDLGPRLDTLRYCQHHRVSPLMLMERLYDARWQGILQFYGAEDCLLIECLRPLDELRRVTNEQLGMKDFKRQKQRQLDQMLLYAATLNCREGLIRKYFGEKITKGYRCNRCDVCNPGLPVEEVSPDNTAMRMAVAQFLEQRETPELTGKYIDTGIALAFHSVVSGHQHIRTEVGERVYRYKYAQEKPQRDWLVSRAVKLLEEQEYVVDIDIVVYVPGTQSENRLYEPVCLFAEKLGKQIDRPLIHGLRKTRSTRPQKEMQTAEQKVRNVRGAFVVIKSGMIASHNVLLVDDLFDSGATINECARMLKQAGARKVFALTLTKTTHVAK